MKRKFLIGTLCSLLCISSFAQEGRTAVSAKTQPEILRSILKNSQLSITKYTDTLDRVLIMNEHNRDSSIAILKAAINAAANSKNTLHLAWNI